MAAIVVDTEDALRSVELRIQATEAKAELMKAEMNSLNVVLEAAQIAIPEGVVESEKERERREVL